MKRYIVFILLFAMVLSLVSCGKTSKGIGNYQDIYRIIDNWNRSATPGQERENLFGYGGYLYNSYLLLFPRSTPKTLSDFYFKWEPGIDVDGYGVYFTCKLSDSSFVDFEAALNSFSVQCQDEVRSLYIDTSHFSLPTYIIQWLSPADKWETEEYIMLDKETNTAVFVYATIGMLDKLEYYSSYKIKPDCNIEELIPSDQRNFSSYSDGFSVYYSENMEDAVYDLTLLNLLN